MASSKNIIIAGAGLSGLTAAYKLQQKGFKPSIVEASKSVGGRVRTLREPFDGRLYAEAGAMAISSNDTHLLKLLHELKLPLQSISDRVNKARYRSDNRWHDINEPCSTRNLPDALKHCSVSGLLQHYISKSKRYQLKPDIDCSSISRDLLALDEISLADFLRREGASEREIYLIASFSSAALLGDGIEHLSALQYLMRFGHKQDAEYFTLKNGNDQIISTLVQQLQTPPLTGLAAITVEQQSSAVNVICQRADGSKQEVQGDAFICTIPLPVLKNISFIPPLSEDKQTAISVLANSYTSVSRVFFQCSPRPQLPDRKSAQAIIDLPAMLVEDHTFHLKDTPDAVLEAHTIGDQAREVANMPGEECIAHSKKILEEIYPDTRVNINKSATILWDQEPHHHGAYLSFRPSEMQHLPVIACPENHIYFAGEHVSMLPGSLEGAVCSAEEAVRKILSSFKG